MNTRYSLLALVAMWIGAAIVCAATDDGVFVRFRLLGPVEVKYYVKLGGYTHQANWYLPAAVIPAGAETKDGPRVAAGEFTPWFDLATYAGKSLHRKLNLAGGIAEFPNVTAQFVVEPESPRRDLEIELATAPDAAKVVKRWHETFEGDLTSFLVSPTLAADAAQLETAGEMTERRLRWAQDATGGTRLAPKQLLLQTSFWAPQRPELQLKDAEVLSQLGFNVVGNMSPAVRQKFPHFRTSGASHDAPLGPETDRAGVRATWEKLAEQVKDTVEPGAPFYFQDEICARPPIGTNEAALRHFRDWLQARKIAPAELGVASLDDVVPIETPEALRERMKSDERAARRLF
ncbi:MAG: hypothetical protein ABIP55_07990, partial [Tepidisphaeraceae bacterium]